MAHQERYNVLKTTEVPNVSLIRIHEIPILQSKWRGKPLFAWGLGADHPLRLTLGTPLILYTDLPDGLQYIRKEIRLSPLSTDAAADGVCWQATWNNSFTGYVIAPLRIDHGSPENQTPRYILKLSDKQTKRIYIKKKMKLNKAYELPLEVRPYWPNSNKSFLMRLLSHCSRTSNVVGLLP